MFDGGWFWIFVAFFFIWGPMRWGRRGRWGRWDQADRSGPAQKKSPEDADREARREEQVQQLEARVNELESRLDFAERLLASRRDQVAIPPA